MKKIFFSLMLIMGGIISAQDYYDTYPEYNGYEYYNDSYDYPDDYYYNYPSDYYPADYYNSYYNDYTRSISTVNWNRFFVEFNLSPWQINEIIRLNNRFASYNVWSSYYRYNPDRWYYDRFYALQNILGPNVFAIYERNYYKGNPIVYFQNYRRDYYVVHYHVVPRYRNVNVNTYRIDRNNFRQYYQNNRLDGMLNTNGGVRNNQNAGFNTISNNGGGFRNHNSNSGIRNTDPVKIPGSSGNGGFRNNGTVTSSGGFRSSNNSASPNNSGSGFRNNERNIKNGQAIEKPATSQSSNGGFRNGSSFR